MKQKINICPVEQEVKGKLNLNQIIGVWLSVGLLLIIFSGVLSIMNYSKQSKLVTLVGNDDSRIKNNSEKSDANYNAQMIQEKVEGLKVLKSQNQRDKKQIFSGILTALDKNKQYGLSIEKIEIQDKGADLLIMGYAEKAQQIPIYIAAIQQESDLKGRDFGYFNIKKTNKQEKPIQFNLRSKVK